VCLDFDEVDEHRRDLDTCVNYHKCLFYAAEQQWCSFTCVLCDGTTHLP